MTDHDDVAQRRVHEADPEHVEVRQPEAVEDDSAADNLFRIRMPITSTGEARDGDAFSRDRLEGFVRQLEQDRIPLFLDHGRGGPGETRYGQLRKVGYWAAPSIEERGGATDLDADAVLVDPDTLDDDVGEIRSALKWLRAQAEAGLPISASVGWSEETGSRDVPGDADLLECSIVGIPSDPRTTTTASGEPALARAVASASADFDVQAFMRTLADEIGDDGPPARGIPGSVADELGDQLVPNAGAVEAAQQALDWAEEYPDEFALGSDDGEGLRRARQLVEHGEADERLTGAPEDAPDYWTEIEAFHSRHHAQGNHELDSDLDGEPWRDAGYVAHLAWGGDEGFDQAQDVVAALEAMADDEDVDYERDTGRNLDDPEFSEGDAVEWSSNDVTVRGRVADVGEQFSPAGADVTITGEEGEAVYLIHELDDSLSPPQYRRENVAKPQSSLDESQADLPPLDGNFADEANSMTDDTDTDTESADGADTDEREEPSLRAMEEKMDEMRGMIEENTRMTDEIHQEMMGDGDADDEDGDMEEESADTDADAEADTDAEPEPEPERTVTLDGEETTVDEALDRLREAADDVEPSDLDAETTDRAEADDAADADDTHEPAEIDWRA